MPLQILSKEFFSNYLFNPNAEELSTQDKRKARIGSICFGILTLGLCHLVCAIKYHNRKYSLADVGSSPSIQKVEQTYKSVKGKEKEWTFEELMATDQLSSDEIYLYAKWFKNLPIEQLQLLKKAAGLDHVPSISDIAHIYHFGSSKIPADGEQALLWLKKGALLRDHRSCQTLMNIYLEGQGVPQDLKEAEKWLVEALKYGKNVCLPAKEGNAYKFFTNAEDAKKYIATFVPPKNTL